MTSVVFWKKWSWRSILLNQLFVNQGFPLKIWCNQNLPTRLLFGVPDFASLFSHVQGMGRRKSSPDAPLESPLVTLMGQVSAENETQVIWWNLWSEARLTKQFVLILGEFWVVAGVQTTLENAFPPGGFFDSLLLMLPSFCQITEKERRFLWFLWEKADSKPGSLNGKF